ncbi:MAG: ferritin-like domain-containing protein [Acidimicrobiales bacterium]
MSRETEVAASHAEAQADGTSGFSRRSFLVVGSAASAAVVVAACSKSKSNTATTATSAESGSSTTGAAGGNGDAKTAMLAASLEVLAVGTYKAALDAATANKLGTVPPAVANFAQTVMGHHQAALDKWNSVLTGAGAQAVNAPPADLKAKVDTAFAAVKDVTGVAKLALLLEQTAADTYLSAAPTLVNKDAITLASALQSVDQEHAAILLYVLGEYPVPDVFQKTDKAYSPPPS